LLWEGKKFDVSGKEKRMKNYNFRIYPREIQTKRLFKNFDCASPTLKIHFL
jgi:hypothetical protein